MRQNGGRHYGDRKARRMLDTLGDAYRSYRMEATSLILFIH
jgi:hypothetical protein